MAKITAPEIAVLISSDGSSLNLAHRDLISVEELSVFPTLKKIDASYNRLVKLDWLQYNVALSWLSVAHNGLTSLKGIERLSNLRVLNAAHNHICVITDIQLRNLTNLQALILNDNKLQRIPPLTLRHTALNTLTLSHNLIETLDNIHFLTNLKKLSLSHNSLYHIPPLGSLKALQQLRLSHNKIHTLSNSLVHNVKLKILDLGHNRISTLDDVKVLQLCTTLRQLTLSGNPLAATTDYPTQVARFLPFLKLLDGRRLRNKNKDRILATSSSHKKNVQSAQKRKNKEDSEEKTEGDDTLDAANDNKQTFHDEKSSERALLHHKRRTSESTKSSLSHYTKRQKIHSNSPNIYTAPLETTAQLDNSHSHHNHNHNHYHNNKVNNNEGGTDRSVTSFPSQTNLSPALSSVLTEKDDEESDKFVEETKNSKMKSKQWPESSELEAHDENANSTQESGIRRVYVHHSQRRPSFDVNELLHSTSVESSRWDLNN